MSVLHRGLWVLVGVVVGALAAWGLGLAYLELFESVPGDLGVPFVLVASVGGLLARRIKGRWFGLGVIAGAALETVFYLYLFT